VVPVGRVIVFLGGVAVGVVLVWLTIEIASRRRRPGVGELRDFSRLERRDRRPW
jgi:hypothetical protein